MSETIAPTLLILRPQKQFGIVTAELKRVVSLGQFMMLQGTVRSEQLSADSEWCSLAKLCEELQLGNLYGRYANKKMFRHEKDFWETEDAAIKSHVKRMADRRLVEAVRLAAANNIPILYAVTEREPLHISNRLTLDDSTVVLPVMNFDRHADGTDYRLQLRMGELLVETLSDHKLIVLGYEPGMFVLDGQIHIMGEGFSGKLLQPFVKTRVVKIPQKLENDYFRKFILKNVARVEVNATGFDIEDVKEQLVPCLTAEKSIDGRHLLSLHFKYGQTEYTPASKTNGRVTLREEDGRFRFVRQLRDKQQEQHFVQLLQQTSTPTTPEGGIRFASLAEMVGWLRLHGPRLRAQGFSVVQPSEQVYYIGPLSVEQSDSWHGDWLQTDVTIVLDDGRLRIPFRELRDTILHGEQEFMLPTGERLLIPQEWLQRYSNLLLTGMPKGEGFQRHRSQVDATEPISTTADAILPISLEPPKGLKAQLRPYQQTGYEWLCRNFSAQTGCCLSDEMGLGKTLQTIALLLKYKETAKAERKRQPQPGMLFSDEEMQGAVNSHESVFSSQFKTSLVVAPASVVHNWRNELQRFAPSLLVCTYTGAVGSRRDKRLALMRWDVVLTTYRTLLNDIDFFAGKRFGMVVFDESQAFKSASSQIHQAVSRLQALHRIALSGTPVENNLNELWSLMNVLNPNLLGDARTFQQSFVNPIAFQLEESRRELLRRLIAPYFLKRTKDEVLTDLPERQDEVVVCPMTEQQVSQYAVELSRARNEWLDPATEDSRRNMNMLAAIQRLRQIANGEGKMSVVFEHLENLRSSSHKVLIFSEYVSLLERVGAEMQQREWQYDMLTGKTQHREQVIAHFQREADCQFFLISLKAGGVGLNLTAADYVFLLDPWWNLAAEEQAIARSHRIGQRQPVFVYRFVSADTLEEQILSLQERKQTLIDSIMPFMGISTR